MQTTPAGQVSASVLLSVRQREAFGVCNGERVDAEVMFGQSRATSRPVPGQY